MEIKTKMALAAIALLFLLAFLGRYDLVGVAPGGEGHHGDAYRLDRWTGEIYWVHGAGGVYVKERQ